MNKIDKNVIPPMTHPLSSARDQPDTKNILIDDNHAIMSESDFDSLHNYSMSIPSGVYPGKMWKSLNIVNEWYLRWFGDDGDKESLPTYTRKILIV